MSKIYVVNQPSRTEYVTREVHEHRAPTDESIKLLREMEDAAERHRVATLHMDGNHLNGLVQTHVSPSSASIHVRAVFDINGQRHTVTTVTRDDESPEAILKALIEDVAKKIAVAVVEPAMRSLSKDLRWK